jgi:hypothetical protein
MVEIGRPTGQGRSMGISSGVLSRLLSVGVALETVAKLTTGRDQALACALRDPDALVGVQTAEFDCPGVEGSIPEKS